MANKDELDQQARRDHDPIHHPRHYTSGAVECIDAIEAALGPEGFIAFLRGQVLKYNWRMGQKDAPAQEAGKAKWYMDKLAERCGSGKAKTLAEWGAEKQAAKRRAEQLGAAQSQAILNIPFPGLNQPYGRTIPVTQPIQGAALTDKKEISNGTIINDCMYGTFEYLRSRAKEGHYPWSSYDFPGHYALGVEQLRDA